MRYLDLFSGIGGFALGLYWAGWRFDEHYFSEIEPYCVELYQKRFPNAIPLGDIKEIDCGKLPKGEWVITGGFPCQDISIAGKGEGIQAERSGLWFEMWRVIRELRPRWVVAENVGAITFRGLGAVVNSLAKIGYDCEWQDIRASDVGAPHRRERIWIVAYPNRTGLPRQSRNTTPEQNSNGEEIGLSQQRSQDVADTEEAIGRGSGREENTGGRHPEARRCGISRDWAEHWAVEPDVGRVAHGVPARVDRLKGLGNAIVPQIAELIFRQIDESLS